MHELIIWATFTGAWLLVAGPLYQGAVELAELDFDREGIEGIKASAAEAAKDAPSPWWWLVPPVMYVLHRRWVRAYRAATWEQLTETQRVQLSSFRNKATGWFTVAAGATLLAAGETWQVTEDRGWPAWLFWLLMVVMLAAAVLNTAVRMIGSGRPRGSAAAAPAPAEQR